MQTAAAGPVDAGLESRVGIPVTAWRKRHDQNHPAGMHRPAAAPAPTASLPFPAAPARRSTPLTREIPMLHVDGDYEAAGRMLEELGVVADQLEGDLDRIDRAGIPVDMVFRRSEAVLGLESRALSADST